MILMTIKTRINTNKETEWFQTSKTLLEAIRQEPGCSGAMSLRDAEDGERLVILQEWDDWASLRRHMKTDRCRVLFGALRLLTEESEIKFHTVACSFGLLDSGKWSEHSQGILTDSECEVECRNRRVGEPVNPAESTSTEQLAG
jgi:quinol monooxygenase YgiN